MKRFTPLKVIILVFSILLIIPLLGACGEDEETTGIETEKTTISTPEPITDNLYDLDKIINSQIKKPVIYLYPEEPIKVSLKLDYKGKLVFTYPAYNQGWNVLAKPDGTLTNLSDGKEYSYLFWDGITEDRSWDLTKGFVVEGSKTAEFLQSKLSEIGLLPKEYNEFIVYWAPLMQNNQYNLITFQSEYYENLAKLDVQPKPDSMLRVFMVYKPLDRFIEVPFQTFPKFLRNGFTLVEWGGTEAK